MEDTNLWNKKTADLTVNDTVKMMVVATACTVVVTALIGTGVEGTKALVKKIQKSRKAAKEAK